MNRKSKQKSTHFLAFSNRKGIMVKFLVTIILAIIIFVPSCMFVNKILDAGTRSSTQAKDNFVNFTKQLNEFAFDKEKLAGKRESTLLILDKETAVVYFKNTTSLVVVDVDSIGTDYAIFIRKPSTCKVGKNCICLLRKTEFESQYVDKQIIAKPKRFLCENLDYELSIDTCSNGEPVKVNSYKCKNGFLIERHFVEASDLSSYSYYEVQRRSHIHMLKGQNSIRITGVS